MFSTENGGIYILNGEHFFFFFIVLQIQKLEESLRKQAYRLVHNKKQQRQFEEEIKWSQVEMFIFSHLYTFEK